MRRAILVLAAIAAMSVFADGPRAVQTRPVVMPLDGYVMRARLQIDWAMEDGAIVPPAELRDACRIRGIIRRGASWEDVLVTDLYAGTRFQRREQRTLTKIDGRVAVRNSYADGASTRVEDVYINLEDLERDAVAVLTLEHSDGGGACEMTFRGFTSSATFARQSESNASPK
ncbi:MAG TPA: hypothetical protein VF787_08055 [Thermoanaerobaculia bacterium]